MSAEGAENPVRRVVDGLTGSFRGLMAAAVDAVYPPVCSGCGRMVGQHRGVCPSCWATLRLIERPYCEVLGLPFSHDLGAGILSADAIANPPVFERLRSVAIHDGIARSLVHGLKYRDRTDLAVMMADWMIRASDGMSRPAMPSCLFRCMHFVYGAASSTNPQNSPGRSRGVRASLICQRR